MTTRISLGARVAMYAALSFLAVLWLYPIWLAFHKSIANGGWHNYAVVLKPSAFNYWLAIGNSFLIAGVSAVVIVFISAMAGFAFAKLQFVGKRLIYNLLLACLAVPIASIVTPLFFTVNKFGLLDSYTGVIVPLVAFNVLIMLMIMRTHFDGLPDELIEAAQLDGVGTFGIFWRVLMPLSGPSLATVGVLSFVYCWNEYLLPTLLLQTPHRFPVTVAISLLQSDRMSQEQISQLYAGLVLMTIPSVIVYLVSQRYLQSGVTAGAVKS